MINKEERKTKKMLNTNNSKNYNKKKNIVAIVFFRYLIKTCFLPGLFGILTATFFDIRWYQWRLHYFSGIDNTSNSSTTPTSKLMMTAPFLSNLQFNVGGSGSSLYGTHPPLWYFYAGMPAVLGVLTPFFLWELGMYIFRDFFHCTNNNNDHQHRHQRRVRAALMPPVLSHMILHSFSSHKEFRFLLPIIPPICIICGSVMSRFVMYGLPMLNAGHDNDYYNGKSKKTTKKTQWQHKSRRWKRALFLCSILFLLNVPHFLYLGLIHQRGGIDFNFAVTDRIIEIVHSNINNNNNNNNNSNMNYINDTHTEQGTGKNDSSSTSSSSTSLSSPSFTVHHLAGCHSAPAFSHLHAVVAASKHASQNPVNIKLWTLDCSPSCRRRTFDLNNNSNDNNNNKRKSPRCCESDQFVNNPLGFMKDSYQHYQPNHDDHFTPQVLKNDDCHDSHDAIDVYDYSHDIVDNDNGNNREDSTRKDDTRLKAIMEAPQQQHQQRKRRPAPDFLLMFEPEYNSSPDMARFLSHGLGMVEVRRFRHAVSGIRFVQSSNYQYCNKGMDNKGSSNDDYSHREKEVSKNFHDGRVTYNKGSSDDKDTVGEKVDVNYCPNDGKHFDTCLQEPFRISFGILGSLEVEFEYAIMFERVGLAT